MDCLLKIDHLYFSYGREQLFEDLSLSLYEQQIVGLLGLNGQGKSTLLKLLGGVLALPAKIKTDAYRNFGGRHAAIGYMPERPLFYPELTVLDNVRFAAQLHGVDKSCLQQQVEQTLSGCRLQEKRRKAAGNLSKGYQQRLGLAMAIVHQPRLLLLDEPIDGMDPGQVRETHKLISELSAHTSLLISSHRVFEMTDLCHRVLILHEGCIRKDLLLGDDFSQQQLSDVFEEVTTGQTL